MDEAQWVSGEILCEGGEMMDRKDDEVLLNVLDAISRGCKTKAIREEFGITNAAVQGIKHRHRKSDLPCECKKPENRDGGMSERWWAA